MATTPTSGKEKEPRSAASSLTPNTSTSPANFGVNVAAAANVFASSTMDNVEGMLRLTSNDRRQVRSRSRPPPKSPFVPMKEKGPHKFSYLEEKDESQKKHADTPRPQSSVSSLKTPSQPPLRRATFQPRTQRFLTLMTRLPGNRSSDAVFHVHCRLPTPSLLETQSPTVRAHVSRIEQARLEQPSSRGSRFKSAVKSASKSSECASKSPADRSSRSKKKKSTTKLISGTRTPSAVVVSSSALPTAKSPSAKSEEKSEPLSAQSFVNSPAEKSSGYPTARSPTVRSGKSSAQKPKIVKSTPPVVYASRFSKSPLQKSSGYSTAKGLTTSSSVATGIERSPAVNNAVEKSASASVIKKTQRRLTPVGRASRSSLNSPATAVEKSPSDAEGHGIKTPMTQLCQDFHSLSLITGRSPTAVSSKTLTPNRSSGYPTARSPSPLTAIEPSPEQYSTAPKSPILHTAQGPGVVVRQPSFSSYDREFVAPKTSEIFDTQHPTRLSRQPSKSPLRVEIPKMGGQGPQIPSNSDGTYEMTMICDTATPGQKIRLRFNIDSIMESQPGVRNKESSLCPRELSLNDVIVWKK